ncbi:MAG: hypothetical protein ACOC58_03020 [Chloroflexota bacterium]
MKKWSSIALVLVILVTTAGLAFAACGGGEPTGDETQKVRLSWAYPITPGYFGSPSSESSYYYFEEAVETVTEGRIDIELYPSETLNKQELAYDAVKSGIADIAWGITSYSPEWVPEDLVFYLPLDMESCEMNYQVKMFLNDEYAKDAYAERDLIHATCLGREAYIVFSPRHPLYRLEDFEGRTIMTSGRSMEELISRLGALSITINWQDAYEALEKGTLDLSALDITLPMAFRWYEVGDPGYIIDVGGIGNAKPDYFVRTDFMERFRPEDAYAMVKLLDVWLGARSSIWSDGSNILYWEEVPKVGMEFIDWEESEKERLREVKEEVYFDWFPQWLEDKYGVPEDEALEYLDAVLEAMDNFERGNVPPGNPASYPEQWMWDMLNDHGYTMDEDIWDEWTGPDGHWGMDYVYMEGWEPWYEEWWDDQGLGEHPWYAEWKAEHGQ